MPRRLARAALHQRSSVLQTGPPGFPTPKKSSTRCSCCLGNSRCLFGAAPAGDPRGTQIPAGCGVSQPKTSHGGDLVLLQSPFGGCISLRDTVAEQREADRGRTCCKEDQTGRFFYFRNGNEENICFVSGTTKKERSAHTRARASPFRFCFMETHTRPCHTGRNGKPGPKGGLFNSRS